MGLEQDLFDTNILIDFLKGIPEAIRAIDFSQVPATSVISWIEVLSGARAEHEAEARSLLSSFLIVGITDAVMEQAVKLRQTTRLKLPDAVILATAQVHGRVLVTRNTKDFPAGMAGVRVPYRI